MLWEAFTAAALDTRCTQAVSSLLLHLGTRLHDAWRRRNKPLAVWHGWASVILRYPLGIRSCAEVGESEDGRLLVGLGNSRGKHVHLLRAGGLVGVHLGFDGSKVSCVKDSQGD